MEVLTLLLALAILAETTFLLVKVVSQPHAPSGRRKVYVDTSTLMDPRFLEVARTGFISDELLIPRSVTHELQLLADGKEAEKRSRARAALASIRELERIVHFNITIIEDPLDGELVDNRLMELAKSNRALILTNDYNLQKVAETEHIDVLNLNQLALVLKNEHYPGERARVRITGDGSNPGQGVGYLADGTMVVIDNAAGRAGQELDIELIRLNQTAAGVLAFARLTSGQKSSRASSRASSAKKPTGRAAQPAPNTKVQSRRKPYTKRKP